MIFWKFKKTQELKGSVDCCYFSLNNIFNYMHTRKPIYILRKNSKNTNYQDNTIKYKFYV